MRGFACLNATLVSLSWGIMQGVDWSSLPDGVVMQSGKTDNQLAVRLVSPADACVDYEEIVHCRWPMYIFENADALVRTYS